MKTISFNKAGDPGEVLELVEKEIPSPGGNEVLVKITGSPVNPADRFFIEGTYRFKPEFPHQTAGLEGAGIIVKAGKATHLRKGTLVAFLFSRSWAEYAVIPAEELVVLPADFPVEKAVQFCLNPFTAWGILEEARLQPGEWLLLTAANSNVSQIVIQLAKQRNINIIAIIRKPEQAPGLYDLGAKTVLYAEEDNLDKKINEITAGKGVNAALDAVGGKTGTTVIKNMALFGRLIIYGRLKDEPVQFYNAQITYKNLTIKGFGIRAFLNNQTKQQRENMVKTLVTEIAKPAFKLPVANVFAWDEFKEAWKATTREDRKGKIIFKAL